MDQANVSDDLALFELRPAIAGVPLISCVTLLRPTTSPAHELKDAMPGCQHPGSPVKWTLSYLARVAP